MRQSGYVLFLLILLPLCFYSQNYIVQGKVLAKNDGEPIAGADVFYDGTSIGTITDMDGFFELDSKNPINSPLVIRFLGYKTIIIQRIESSFNEFFLEEDVTQLEGVTLEPDTWSRAKKLAIFKKEFLGRTNHGSRILNPKVIRLYYKLSNKTLYAYADVPIEISNKKLRYAIKYDLQDFEVTFGQGKGASNGIRRTYYRGASQFTDLKKGPGKRIGRLRDKTYLGSLLHFFRSMYESRLSEEGYRFITKGKETPVSDAYESHVEDGMLVVKQKIKGLGIFYHDEWSYIKSITNPIYVDSYGIFLPPNGIEVAGIMGVQRVGSMLPADYAYQGNMLD